MSVDVYENNRNHDLVAFVEEDTEPCESPRVDCDNLGTFITWMGRYHSPDSNPFDTIEDFYEHFNIKKMLRQSFELFERPSETKMVILPVYAYIHGSVVFSTKPFADCWDSGFVGMIYVTYDDIRVEYSCERVTKTVIESVTSILESEIEQFNCWLNEPHYFYSIVDLCSKETIDSCGGYHNTSTITDYLIESGYVHAGTFRSRDSYLFGLDR